MRGWLTRVKWVFCLLLSDNESACQCRRHRRHRFDPWVGKILWRRKWQPTPVFLPGKFHGQRHLAGCSSWGYSKSDTVEHTQHSSKDIHILTPGTWEYVRLQVHGDYGFLSADLEIDFWVDPM